jgi:hypothetical protein
LTPLFLVVSYPKEMRTWPLTKCHSVQVIIVTGWQRMSSENKQTNVNPSQHDSLQLPFDCTTSDLYRMATKQKHGYNECDSLTSISTFCGTHQCHWMATNQKHPDTCKTSRRSAWRAWNELPYFGSECRTKDCFWIVTNQKQRLLRKNLKGILVNSYHLGFDPLFLDGNNGWNKALVTGWQQLIKQNNCYWLVTIALKINKLEWQCESIRRLCGKRERKCSRY